MTSRSTDPREAAPPQEDVALSLTQIKSLLAIAWESGAQPLVLLTKADCRGDAEAARSEVEAVAYSVPVLCVSVLDGSGTAELRAATAGRTVVLLGESGAGKSTLANLLAGEQALETGEVRRDGQGRHTTTHRELVPLPGGGAIIDTPGVREAGYWVTERESPSPSPTLTSSRSHAASPIAGTDRSQAAP